MCTKEEAISRRGDCEDESCRYWIRCGELKNCVRRLTYGDCYSLQQIGDMMGVSRERVRQVEEGALGKLRKLIEGLRRKEKTGL